MTHLSSSILLFSSDLERDAAFPDGAPAHLRTAIAGVGIIDSAIGTVRIIERERPGAVVFIGTCGAHRESGLAIGDMVIASRASLASGDVARGAMRLPSLLNAGLAADEVLMQELINRAAASGTSLKPVRVSTTLGITEDDVLATELNDYGFGDVENMEAFAVLRAAALAEPSVPAAVLLGITNIVGPGGGRDWAANFKEMMRKAADAVIA
jgi:nucleoside phosphorylase